MSKQYHILNGDSLKKQFPENIQGELIVFRECLVDGDVGGSDLSEFFHTRAQFISANYEACKEEDYFEKTVPELRKIQQIAKDSTINLWFEDDLFCQVNFWFVVHLLQVSFQPKHVFIVRPETPNQYGFGGLDKGQLTSIFKGKLPLTELDKIAKLWELYQKDDTRSLLETAKALESNYPFILPAVQAHIARIPRQGNAGRPTLSLIAIMKDLGTEEFGPVFKEFCKREAIYGFGDLQVKRLMNEIKHCI